MNTLTREDSLARLLPYMLAGMVAPGRVHFTPTRVRRHEHECTECQTKLPPGRQGRKCETCRK